MQCTVTEYRSLANSSNNTPMQPIGDCRQRTVTTLIAGGDVTLQEGTLLARVATDTAILFDPTGTGHSDYIPAGTAEIFSVLPGVTVTIAAA